MKRWTPRKHRLKICRNAETTGIWKTLTSRGAYPVGRNEISRAEQWYKGKKKKVKLHDFRDFSEKVLDSTIKKLTSGQFADFELGERLVSRSLRLVISPNIAVGRFGDGKNNLYVHRFKKVVSW